MKNLDHNRLLNKIARLYYEQELTQNEIAGQLRLSRQKVQRFRIRQNGLSRSPPSARSWVPTPN
jgi:DNA-binding transcriptional regulator LsrR (DeoR family)